MKITVSLLLLGLSLTLAGQGVPFLEINLTKHSLQELAEAGVEVDHGAVLQADGTLQVVQLPNTKAVLDRLGASYRERSLDVAARQSDGGCARPALLDQAPPTNFRLGTLEEGFYTLEEIYAEYDRMRMAYPDLISASMEVGTLRTHEDRPLRYYRLSTNPDVEEPEPKVFFNALHHAREPLSVISQVYFVWWLLERYDSDTEARWLLDNTEVYLMPVLNPDGYAFNIDTATNSLGFWRKNRRDNGDGTFGVDLNRNYPYDWGNLAGSSDDPDSDVYHGPTPASEPEVQAAMQLAEELDFATVLNVHSFSDLLVHPSFSGLGGDEVLRQAHDHTGFSMRRDNNYSIGEGGITLNYAATGNSDDFLALDPSRAQNCLSYTPEVGSRFFGFHPPRDTVEGMAREMLLPYWRGLQSAHFTAVVDELPVGLLSPAGLSLQVRRIGSAGGIAQVRVHSLDGQLVFPTEVFTVDLRDEFVQDVQVPVTVQVAGTTTLAGYRVDVVDQPHVKGRVSGPLTWSAPPVVEAYAGMALVNHLQALPVVDSSGAVRVGFDSTANASRVQSYSTDFSVADTALGFRVEYAVSHGTSYGQALVSVEVRSLATGEVVACPNHDADPIFPDDPQVSYWGVSPGFVREALTVEDAPPGDYELSLSFGGGALGYFYFDSLRIAQYAAPRVVSGAGAPTPVVARVFPNPARGVVTLVVSTGAALGSAWATDARGRRISLAVRGGGQVDVSSLAAGVYALDGVTAAGRVVRADQLVVE